MLFDGRLFAVRPEDMPHLESLQAKLDARAPHDIIPVTHEEMTAIRNSAPVPQQAARDDAALDREDVEMFFRSLMQFARHLAKKYGFKIKQWPEN